MRVAFVPADTGGCMYYRCWVPGQHLRRRGHDVSFVRHTNDLAFQRADVAIFQRQCSPFALGIARDVRKRGAVVLHEFDDNFHEMPASNPSAPFFAGTSIARTLEHFCVESHGLLVSTPDLATEYSRFNQRTYVCYNAIDDRQAERFVRPLKSGAKREGQVRIGYAGSDTHAGDFAMILPALCRLMITRPKVRLVFIGANQRNLIPERFWGQTEFLGGTGSAADLPFDDPRADATTERRLGSVSYYDVVQAADFDIGIAPIAPVTFNRCKSYLKVMEYGMLGIPAVATRYGPYLQYQAEAKEPVVRLVDSPDAWEQVLQEMVDDAEMRVTLAGANHAYVHRAHLMSRRVRAWEDTLLAATACRDTAA